MNVSPSIEDIQRKFEALRAGMNEAVRRRWAATEAKALGRGGISLVANATGLSRPAIRRGLKELEQGVALDIHRARRRGGGRKDTVYQLESDVASEPADGEERLKAFAASISARLLGTVAQIPAATIEALRFLSGAREVPTELFLR